MQLRRSGIYPHLGGGQRTCIASMYRQCRFRIAQIRVLVACWQNPRYGFSKPSSQTRKRNLLPEWKRHVDTASREGNQFGVDLEDHKKNEPKYSSSLFTKWMAAWLQWKMEGTHQYSYPPFLPEMDYTERQPAVTFERIITPQTITNASKWHLYREVNVNINKWRVRSWEKRPRSD